MIILGIVLLLIGYLLVPIPLLVTLGIILIVIGVVLELLSGIGGYTIGGRRHWY